jgi:hypothetical protein
MEKIYKFECRNKNIMSIRFVQSKFMELNYNMSISNRTIQNLK